MTVPKTFEFPFFIIGKQARNRIKKSVGKLPSMILSQNNKSKSINHKRITKSLEKKDKYIEA